VRHSELCVPGYTSVFFRFPSPADANSPVFSRFTIIDLAHIIRLEPLETVPATAGNGSEG
jgi:hypothetical protein